MWSSELFWSYMRIIIKLIHNLFKFKIFICKFKTLIVDIFQFSTETLNRNILSNRDLPITIATNTNIATGTKVAMRTTLLSLPEEEFFTNEVGVPVGCGDRISVTMYVDDTTADATLKSLKF